MTSHRALPTQDDAPIPTFGATPNDGTTQQAADAAQAGKDAAVDVAQQGTQAATEVARHGKDAAAEVASTATDAAKDVAQETKDQARDLVGKTKTQLDDQVRTQQASLVDTLRSLGEQLSEMTTDVEHQGTAVDVAAKARDHATNAADWLDGREPADVLDELRKVGRNRPGLFLLGAVAAGVVAGRLTRGAVDVHTADQPGTDDTTRTGDTTGTGSPVAVPTQR